MADKQSFLSKQGLALYNAKLTKEKLQPATELKRGLMKLTDLPCYTSNIEQKYSGSFETGSHGQDDEKMLDFSFLAEDVNGDVVTKATADEAVFPSYTVYLDGKVFEHVSCSVYSGSYLAFSLRLSNNSEIAYSDYPWSRLDVYGPDGLEDDGVSHNIKIYKEGVETVHKLDKKYAPAMGLRDIEGALDITTVENHLGGMTMAADGSVTESHSDYAGATFTESTDTYTIEAFEWNLGIGLHDLESKTIKVVLDDVTYQANPIMIQDDGNVVYYLFGALSPEELAEETDQEFLGKYAERGFADFPFKMYLCIIIRTDSQTQVQTPVFAIWEGYLSEAAHTLELSMVEESEKIKSKYLSVEIIPDAEINDLFATQGTNS